jgi:iron transport multicopper oxidase
MYDFDDGELFCFIRSLPTLTRHQENTIITLSDWYHLQSPSITGIAANDATLINGVGRYPGGPQVDLAEINVVQGKRYRFRIIAMSCDPNYIFSIDGHPLTIIEADGQNTQPYTVDSIQILAGA